MPVCVPFVTWIAAGMFALSIFLIGATARAGGIALLTDPAIGPYADTVAGLRASGGAFVEFDVHAPNVVESIRAANPDVVVAVGQQALSLVSRQMGSTPIVFANVLAPQQYGLAPNVTGVPLEVSPAAQLEYVRGVAPRLRRIGVLYNPATWTAFIDEARNAARADGIELVAQPIASVREVQQAVQQLVPAVDALLLLPDPSIWSQVTISFALLFGLQNGRPVLGFLDALTQAGALVSIAPDYRAIGVRARGLVDEIMARPAGARSTVPRIAYHRGRFSVNMATAARLQIVVPTEAVNLASRVFR